MKKLKWTINPTANFTKKELVRVGQARVNLEFITNHELFKQEFLRADFSGETSAWRHKTNLEIYEHFMSGAEKLRPEKDNEADIDLDIFNPSLASRNTVGYTYGHVLKQWINRKFFWAMAIWGVMGNIAHEWGHKLGFDHDRKSTKRRPYSICYQLNKIIKFCYLQLIEQADPFVAMKVTYVPAWKRVAFFWKY